MTPTRLALALLALPAAVLAVTGVVACRQVLGVQDLGVGDAGAGAEGGGPDPGAACHAKPTTEGCYSCCALIDGGDLGFFQGDLHACACNSQCSNDCPVYCGPTAPADTSDCDLCIYDESFAPLGECNQRAAAAGQATPGAALIYQCLAGCKLPSDSECAGLATRQGCYDCCSGQHVAAREILFGNTAQSCTCDAGCASACPGFCADDSFDGPVCAQCVLDSLADGGCASTGAALCSNAECQAMQACMLGCAQGQ